MTSLIRIYECLCDPTRLRILHLLGQGPLCVCHFQHILGESQVKVSKHLAYLRTRGLVRAERDGTWMIYSLPKKRAPELEENLRCLHDCVQTEPEFQADLRKLSELRADCCEPAGAPGRQKARVKKYLAETFGTFTLVFAGTGGIVIDQVSGGAVTHVGVGLTFGLVVMAMIYAVGDVSGAHFNPAVTLGFFAARRFPGRQIIPYLASQGAGAVCASLVLRFLFPHSPTLGGTFPAGPAAQAFVLELLLTCILMFVILAVSTGAKERGITAAIAIGGVIALEALFAGPISAASMNPARSLGPALVSGRWSALWIYLLAPIAGALLGVALCRATRNAAIGPIITREEKLNN